MDFMICFLRNNYFLKLLQLLFFATHKVSNHIHQRLPLDYPFAIVDIDLNQAYILCIIL